MSIFQALANLTSDYRARRRRYYNYVKLRSLPVEIQKDIGWMEARDRVEQDAHSRNEY